MGLIGYLVGGQWVMFAQNRDWLRPLQNGVGEDWSHIVSKVGITSLGVLVGLGIGSLLARQATTGLGKVDRIPLADKVSSMFSLLLGFGTTGLVFLPLLLTGREDEGRALWLAPIFLVAASVMTYFWWLVVKGIRDEFNRWYPRLGLFRMTGSPLATDGESKPKLLDTSVIIDGRLADICQTGIVEGLLYVPQFVLTELQMIADSDDPLRQARGKKGLQVLENMTEESNIPIQMLSDHGLSPDRGASVDSKLVKLAQEMGATVITNDLNLQKVAQLQGVQVLNINTLATMLKPVLMVGEHLLVSIVREGKEPDQGVGFLDDGTMVVVRDGKNHIGEQVGLTVSSLWQTAGGKMIFAELEQSSRPTKPGDLFDESDGGGAGRGAGQKESGQRE